MLLLASGVCAAGGKCGRVLPPEMRQLALLGPPARRTMRRMSLPFERELFRPAGREVFSFCSIGRLRGGRQGGRLWGFAPFSAPLASPPKHPLQIFNYRAFARAARLLLRELPALRSGDLPARRAMPSAISALIGYCLYRRARSIRSNPLNRRLCVALGLGSAGNEGMSVLFPGQGASCWRGL